MKFLSRLSLSQIGTLKNATGSSERGQRFKIVYQPPVGIGLAGAKTNKENYHRDSDAKVEVIKL